MMIRTDRWQLGTAENLSAILALDDKVRALIVFGSSARSLAQQDAWADLDVLMVVRDGLLEEYARSLDWLEPLGEVFAYERFATPYRDSAEICRCTVRACLGDFRRLDVVITTEDALERIGEWRSVPFWAEKRMLFSSSSTVNMALDRLAEHTPAPLPPNEFLDLENAFWFKGVMAVAKVARGDRLVALHLALDLIRDCLALAMRLRDREGGDWDHVIEQLADVALPVTAGDILDSLAHSADIFDQLAAAWSAVYQARAKTFRAWIEEARQAL